MSAQFSVGRKSVASYKSQNSSRESGVKFGSENGSCQSSLKGNRWKLGSSLQKDKTFIFMPVQTIEINYKVIEILEADAYGETYRI